MDWTQFWQWLLTAVVGGVVVKILDWIFTSIGRSKQRTEAKVKKVEEQLERISQLIELYSFFQSDKFGH